MMLRFVALVMALFAMVGAHARNPVPMVEPGRVTLHRMDGKSSTTDDVRRAIMTGTQPFGWLVEQDAPGAVQVRYTKEGKHWAVVRISYDANSYQIGYVSSSDTLLYGKDEAGRAVVHPTYNTWVKNLTARIMIPGELVPGAAMVTPPVTAASR